jgi:hypothetical protein
MWFSEQTNRDSEKVEWVTQATKWKVKYLALYSNYLGFFKMYSFCIEHCFLLVKLVNYHLFYIQNI